MLTHIDVFLGVALVMLAVSLLITIVTQLISFTFNLRGRQLQRGLAELFDQLDVGAVGNALARKILTHTLVADGLGKARPVPAISKIDLKALLDNADTLLRGVPIDFTKLKGAITKIDVWFDATMSRVSNRFTMQTRLVTIGCSLLAAFALQLNAFDLVHRLYADSDLRARLAGAADTMVAQGERILAPPSLFAETAVALFKEKGAPLSDPKDSSAPIASREEARAWIKHGVIDPKQADALVARYDAILEDAIKPAVKNWLGDASAIKDQLAGAGFQLVPEPYDPFAHYSIWVFLGVLSSAALLSLGAPFWFNALKTVSNLRPAIAAAVQTRDGAEKDAQAD